MRALDSTKLFLPFATFIIIFTALSVACALLRPYKHRNANISGVILPAICSSALAIMISTPSYAHSTIAADIVCGFVLSLPHCVFYGYIVYRLGKLLKQYCCKTREMEDSVDEQLPCRPANNTGYSQLSEVSCQECND